MSICLNMIVRNESKVITRCLDSVLYLIQSWVIVDTGSTDGTQEVIINYFKEKGIPGELHERPWIDFATDRNFALDLARDKADYLLFIDADEMLTYKTGYKKPTLDAASYYIVADSGGVMFLRSLLVKTSLNWKWEGVVHETIACPDAPPNVNNFKDVFLVSFPDGNRRLNPKKFHFDVEMLKKAYKKEPRNSRLLFYLARSTMANRQYKASIYYFKKMIKGIEETEEAFLCRMDIGLIYFATNKPIEKLAHHYEGIAKSFPTKMEPYFMLARLFRKQKNFDKAFEYAAKGIEKPMDQAGISVEKFVYVWGIRLEYMLAAYALGKKEEGKLAAEAILARKDISQNKWNYVDTTFRALERGDLSQTELFI